MRCKACDTMLTKTEETSRKYASTGIYLDLCNGCFGTIQDDIKTTTRYDIDDEDDYDSKEE